MSEPYLQAAQRREVFEEAVLAFLGVKWRQDEGKTGQGVGDYCNGTSVDECRAQFGNALEQVCATCPN